MVYIGVGSNLGNRIRNIEKAKYLLGIYKINILKSSGYYETLSWPDPTKPKFINIVIQSNTKYSPKKLIDIFKIIENKLGRKKDLRNSPRTCDIDIIAYRNRIISNKISITYVKDLHSIFKKYELNKNSILQLICEEQYDINAKFPILVDDYKKNYLYKKQITN